MSSITIVPRAFAQTSEPARCAVEARGLCRIFRGGHRTHTALENVSFRLSQGRTLAVVGESGAGKSTLGRLITGLDRPTSGDVLICGRPHSLEYGRVSPIQMVFQHPAGALNRILSVAASIQEPVRALPAAVRRARMEQMLVAVGLDPRKASCRPAQLSGGQQQRVVLARALIAKPDVLVCDEPTSALDVSMQALVVNTLLRLQAEFGFACLLVTHDLGVSRVLADEILVLRNGRVEELTPADEFFDSPRSEYARLLLKLAGRLRAAPGNSNEPC